MKKVLLVGLRKEMGQKIQKMFKDSISLRHLDSNDRHDNLSLDTGFDLIVSVTKFTNHSTHQKFRKHPGYMMVNGGYSSVVSKLGAIL